jgi:hypothetical protein
MGDGITGMAIVIHQAGLRNRLAWRRLIGSRQHMIVTQNKLRSSARDQSAQGSGAAKFRAFVVHVSPSGTELNGKALCLLIRDWCDHRGRGWGRARGIAAAAAARN